MGLRGEPLPSHLPFHKRIGAIQPPEIRPSLSRESKNGWAAENPACDALEAHSAHSQPLQLAHQHAEEQTHIGYHTH
jgi:hypothetical protein